MFLILWQSTETGQKRGEDQIYGYWTNSRGPVSKREVSSAQDGNSS